jgi:hypothetical protein
MCFEKSNVDPLVSLILILVDQDSKKGDIVWLDEIYNVVKL